MRMNKLTLALALGSFISLGAMAQNGAVTNAKLYFDEGDYDNARIYIDKAVNHDKTKGKSKTWTYRGLIYQKLADAKSDPSFLETAVASYEKSIELNESKGMVEKAEEKKGAIYNEIINKAFKKYEAEDYAGAYEIYQVGMKVSPKDTLAYVYASTICMNNLKKYDDVVDINDRLIKQGFKKGDYYRNIYAAQLMKGTAEDSTAALATLDRAIADNPESTNFLKWRIDMYMAMGKKAEAKESIEAAIAKEPSNPMLYCLKGSLQSGAEAEATYTKAKELVDVDKDPGIAEYIYFSIGSIYYNQAAEIDTKLRNMDYRDPEFKKNGAKMKAQIKENMGKSIPYFEEAHKINNMRVAANPKVAVAKDVIQSLMNAYIQVGQDAKADEMAKKL